MIKRYFFILIYVLSFNGCTGGLDKRISNLEYSLDAVRMSLSEIQSGLLENDKNIKQELSHLKSESEIEINRQRTICNQIKDTMGNMEYTISDIKSKTDKFCVHTPNENSLQIFPAGQCP